MMFRPPNRIRHWQAALGMALLIACAPPSPGAAEVAQAWVDAWRAQDLEAIYELISSDSLPGQDRDQFVAEQSALLAEPQNRQLHENSELQLGDVRIEGDRAQATLEVQMAGGQALFHGEPGFETAGSTSFSYPINLVHESGGWKVVWPSFDGMNGLTEQTN